MNPSVLFLRGKLSTFYDKALKSNTELSFNAFMLAPRILLLSCDDAWPTLTVQINVIIAESCTSIGKGRKAALLRNSSCFSLFLRCQFRCWRQIHFFRQPQGTSRLYHESHLALRGVKKFFPLAKKRRFDILVLSSLRVFGRSRANFAILPLCSPRKTSLNFLSGFPKFSEADILTKNSLLN